MLLVPRQLRRAGMTGDVPYYGGRMSPAQAYAASHPSRPAPARASPPAPVAEPATVSNLRELLDAGVLTQQEYDALVARVSS